MRQADLILIDGRIVTLDTLVPEAQAMAISAGRVLALGTTTEMLALKGQQSRVIDLGGRMVLPGFQDTHIHLQDSGEDLRRSVELVDAETVEELQGFLRDFAATHDRNWVMGTGWNAGLFSAANLDRHVLDLAVPDRPCFILSSDAHNACLNSKGCEAVGLVKGIADPPNGHFVLDGDGVPSGLVYEDAVTWALDHMPPITDEDYREGVKFAQALANRSGFTGILDASVKERHVRVYADMDRAGELTLRISATARVDATEDAQAALARVKALRAHHQSPMFKVHSAKFFLDGVFENRTAAMIEPYQDAVGGNAALMFSREQILEMFPLFDAARFQIHVHAIGDGAVRAALDGVEEAMRQNGRWPALHQIAHIQVIDPSDIPRFFALGAMANIQPLWAQMEPSITDLVQPMIGPDRSQFIYAFRKLVDQGAPYTLSSDWNVSTLDPFLIMEVACTRQAPGEPDDPPLLPDQRLTRQEALMGYTVNAARAAWNFDTCGSLATGKYADFIVVDRDILACDIYELGETEVLLTVLEGREVYRAEGFTA